MSGSVALDKTGFPYLGLEEWGFNLSVYPVAKAQFERFLANKPPQDGRWSHAWYVERLTANPRVPVGDLERPWGLWITGLDNDDVDVFCRFLGPGHRLPRLQEWRLAFRDRTAWEQAVKAAREAMLGMRELAWPARLWLERRFVPTPGDGLPERVADRPDQVVGRPDPRWHPNVWAVDSAHILTEAGRHLAGFRVLQERVGR